MTIDEMTEPRCSNCEHVLPRAGAICHVCDVDAHFEGALRTAPPILSTLHLGQPLDHHLGRSPSITR